MISIIAPCLNEEAHLPAFLENLLFQWVKDFELIIVDGGSTDKSSEIIDSYDHNGNFSIYKIINLKRNLGAVRNYGAVFAAGDILLFTNSDAVLPNGLLAEVNARFHLDPTLQAFTVRTVPWNGGLLCSAAYCCFDLLRWLFSHFGKFSPSGNFLAIRKSAFWAAGGFPEVKLNEDGILGSRIRGKKEFVLSSWSGHFAGRWKQRGAFQTLKFYSYVFGNFSPLLRRILSGVEKKSSGEFDRK